MFNRDPKASPEIVGVEPARLNDAKRRPRRRGVPAAGCRCVVARRKRSQFLMACGQHPEWLADGFRRPPVFFAEHVMIWKTFADEGAHHGFSILIGVGYFRAVGFKVDRGISKRRQDYRFRSARQFESKFKFFVCHG